MTLMRGAGTLEISLLIVKALSIGRNSVYPDQTAPVKGVLHCLPFCWYLLDKFLYLVYDKTFLFSFRLITAIFLDVQIFRILR